MKKNYLTIKRKGNFSQTIKKSEFICTIARITTEKEAKHFIRQISKKYSKARHNCYAYLIGMHDEIQRQSDDGEPGGTAGVPILNALKQNDLHNVIAVVTRYFGGIKLGTNGLIRAYSSTTTEAIAKLGIVERVVTKQITFILSYADFEKAKRYMAQHEIEIDQVKYLESVMMTVLIPKNQIKKFHQDLVEYFNKPIEMEIGKEVYHDKTVTAPTLTEK